MKSADTERLHRPSISFRNGPRTQEGVTGQLSLCYRRKAMLTSEAFIQNIGFISEESVAWLNDEEGGKGGGELPAVEQAMARPPVCSHCSGTRNGKTISLFTRPVEQGMARPSVFSHVQWNREWQDYQYVHMCSGTGNSKAFSLCT